MSRKWMAAAALLVLMLSLCVFALAEEPTDPVYPVPGPLEKHEHTISIKIVGRGYTAHRLNEWCPDCGRLLKERIEGHNFVDGVCTVCDWECPHPSEAAEKHYERDGVKPQWDGNYIIGPGWEITECSICHKVLSRVETTVREFHNVHTHFTPVLECLPHDADTHALIRYCDECGTEVPEYVPHNCPPSDRPYTDEGDPDTHSRLVLCADCGFWVPQQQPHTWVHDSYRKDETDGGEEGHIEVMKCTVCGAKKEVWQPHGAGTHVAYRQDGNADTHIEVLQCPLCNETFETERPHEMEHVSCRNDGDTATHIELLKCTQCEAEAERREAHKPQHIIWKSISDTQHQEIVRCNICGLEIKRNPEAHRFDSFVYVSNDKGSHTVYRACSKCGAVEKNGKTYTEGHTFSGRSCTKCNQSAMHEFGHTFGGYTGRVIQFDDVYHIREVECGVCTCIVKYVNVYYKTTHTFDPVTLKCTACGYLKEGCEHHYSYKLVGTGIQEEQHMLIGTCSGCGKQITETGAHDMQFASATEFKPYGDGHIRTVTERCSVCGYEKQHIETEAHDMQYASVTEFKPYGDGHIRTVTERCSVCGYEKQHTETEAHDMQFVSAAEYASSGDLQHTYTMTERCSVCGYEAQHTETENHAFSFGESLGEQEHKPICALCGGYGIPEPHLFVCTSDESAHVCSVCGEKGEHDYFIAEYRRKGAWIYHVCVYQCSVCMHEKEERQDHTLEILRVPHNEAFHLQKTWCLLCDISSNLCYDHEFDESGVCVCGYHKGDPIPVALLIGEGLTEDSGDGAAVMPVFCHMTADGNEMLFGYTFEPSENGEVADLLLLPESISGDAVIEIRFTASELDLLQSLGIKSVYIRLSDADLLLLSDIGQVSAALAEQERDELVITLTPGSDGVYATQYAPAGVCITE